MKLTKIFRMSRKSVSPKEEIFGVLVAAGYPKHHARARVAALESKGELNDGKSAKYWADYYKDLYEL